ETPSHPGTPHHFFSFPESVAHMALMRVIVILINIEPMKLSILSLTFLLLAKLSASAVVDLGSSTSHTPYDSYMAPVKQVFSSLHGDAPTMDRVNALMRPGRGL